MTPTAEKRHLSLGSRLRVQRAEREIVDRMTPQQRLHAYREGRLSAYQRNHWLCQYPREVPMIDDVPKWIAVTLVDVIDAKNPSPRVRELQNARERALSELSRSSRYRTGSGCSVSPVAEAG